ncbi:MAG: DUF3427 domain-containing protein, partial [Clostridia bacterium]|nr:DUF3427 domain-containing protein [Clostridia bacterium]
EHDRLMAEGMEAFGYKTTYLSASDPTGVRLKKFEDLQDDNNPLNIIFAVDVLNEGVDIPAINMVLFLRPTESSTIFLQQLGRGLRKFDGKTFLTVLDFIGNSYKRSAQIAIALGSLTKSASMPDKRAILDHIATNFTTLTIPGVIIDLDKESKEEILSSLERTNFNELRVLKQDYENFKAFLIKNGVLTHSQYPMPVDYLDQTAGTDLIKYTKKYESYYDFLVKVETNIPLFNSDQINAIRTLSWFLPLVREEEYLILKALISGPKTKEELLSLGLEDNMSFKQATDMLLKRVGGTLSKSFIPLISYDGTIYSLTSDLTNEAFKEWYENLIKYGLEKLKIDDYKKVGLLNMYGQYTGPKAFMALNCRKRGEEIANLMYMTGVHYINDELCLFVNLKKDSNTEERLKYQDYFISNNILHWESQTDTTLTNKKGQKLLETKKAHIFIRKAAKEDGVELPFIYIGVGELTNPVESQKTPPTVLFNIVLDSSIPIEYKYDFGIEDTKDEE